jgi:hypothetical protein
MTTLHFNVEHGDPKDAEEFCLILCSIMDKYRATGEFTVKQLKWFESLPANKRQELCGEVLEDLSERCSLPPAKRC